MIAAIVSLANLWAYSHGGTSDAAQPVFVWFLPMAYFYSAAYQRQTATYVKTLEDRVRLLEGDKATA